MNEDEVQRLRDAIQHDQTKCRCGHLLAACADCMGWMVEHSPRIAAGWRYYVEHIRGPFGLKYTPAGERAANAAQADDLAYYLGGR